MPDEKSATYGQLAEELSALLGSEIDFIANAANTAALLFRRLPDVSWAGFYLHKEGELVLGPFQGKPACVRIGIGRGVCGTSARDRRTVVVADVRKFPGHIACDPRSASEIVVPLVRNGRLLGVLDLDSPKRERFDETDRAGLEKLAAVFLDHTSTGALGG